jgi:hypothetical protein
MRIGYRIKQIEKGNMIGEAVKSDFGVTGHIYRIPTATPKKAQTAYWDYCSTKRWDQHAL